MCGIAGVINRNGEPISVPVLKRMTDAIAHRGPDGEGHYVDGPVGLGHRRLAIIDLSPLGHQPMSDENGSAVLTFNGEIYNFLHLRTDLEARGYRFHSKTDSEVIIHAYREWGDECVSRFDGMFAFAIWDSVKRRVFLARDRFGVKPLYWYCRGNYAIFASEIKAILKHPSAVKDICYEAMNEYFTFQNVFTDSTLFRGVRLLPAGCTLVFEEATGWEPQQNKYWDFGSPRDFLSLNEDEASEALYHKFVHAVTQQMVSDVPIGAYLSGGIDSASITAVAARHVPRLTTFTGGFDLTSVSGLEVDFDERRAAEAMANLLKTEHYEVVMHAGDMEWVLPGLIWHLEDLRVGQCYPNYYVARLASKFVKVVLSGAGGDELFGGYPWRYYRTLGSASCTEYWNRYYEFWQRLVPDEDKRRLFNSHTCRSIGEHSTFDVFRGAFGPIGPHFASDQEMVNTSLVFEMRTFLQGLLVVEDKLSMAHSLEARVPFLDNDLVEFALRLPPRLKVKNLGRDIRIDENLPGKRQLARMQTNSGKAVLRSAVSRLLPKECSERAKQGFSAPDDSWFRGESIDYINRLLRDRNARIYSFLRPDYVTEVLDQHCRGEVNRRLLIWSLLSFEWWLRECFFAEERREGRIPSVAA